MTDIAVIVAHPDDEVLAFGGAMRLHADDGDHVHVLILATGLAAREPGAAVPPAALDHLREQARAAAAELGVATIEFTDFPDNRMDSVALLDVVKAVEDFVGRKRPSVVYTHDEGDLNVDHGVVARAVATACRFLPDSTTVRLCSGEVLSSSEYGDPARRFVPNVYVDVTTTIDAKCRALRCYAEEIREFPHPRSLQAVRHLAALRGSEAGFPAAEAQRLIRERRRRP